MLTKPIKPCLIIGLFVSVSGCMQPLEITQDPISMNAAPSFDQSRVKGTKSLIVRTAIPDVEKNGRMQFKEVAGVKCGVKTKEFSANFQSPAELRVPVLKKKPSPMQLTCSQGALSGAEIISPGIPVATVTGGGLLVGLATLAVTTAVSSAIDEWSYDHAGQAVVRLMTKEDRAALAAEAAE